MTGLNGSDIEGCVPTGEGNPHVLSVNNDRVDKISETILEEALQAVLERQNSSIRVEKRG